MKNRIGKSQPIKKMKLFIIINEDRFLLSHRKEIAVAAQKAGWDVTAVCKDTGQHKDIQALGLKVMELPVNPTGMNILQELKTCLFLYNLYRKNRDAIVHHVGVKNMLWGGLAARMARVRGVVNAVSGRGALFSSKSMGKLARAIMYVMRFANHRERVKVVFQNQEDMDMFLHYGVVEESQVEFIKGSGVDLNVFRYTPEPDNGPLKVVFASRMLKEKGVMEVVQAAELLRKEYEGKVEFWLCGRMAVNKDAVTVEEMNSMCDGHYIQYLGFRKDMAQVLSQCHIVAFPCYYSEGVPKSLIDACAAGRPIVTTNSIGCKDVVDDGENGFLVPVQDSKALADKLRVLIEDKTLRTDMGKAGRAKAEVEFPVEGVVVNHLKIYRKLLTDVDSNGKVDMQAFHNVLDILKSVLAGNGLPRKYTADETRGLMREAWKQTVHGIVLNELSEHQLNLKRENAMKVASKLMSIRRQNVRQNGVLKELAQLLNQHGVNYAVVKGQVAGLNYPDPTLRLSGDIDIFCDGEDFKKAKEVVEQAWHVCYESFPVEHHHISFSYKNIAVEQHHTLIKLYSHRRNAYWAELCREPFTEVSIEGTKIPTLQPTLHVIYIFLHLYHHLLELGVGLRQFCDWAAMLRTHGKEIDYEAMRRHLKALGMERPYRACGALLVDYLGVTEQELGYAVTMADRCYTKRIINIVAYRGNMGYFEGQKVRREKKSLHRIKAFGIKISHFMKFFSLAPAFTTKWLLCEVWRKL